MSSNSEQVQPLAAPKIRRRKRLLQNLALMVGTFFLCGLLLELVLRIAGYGNVELYEPDPILYWKLKPNQNCYTKIDRKPVRVNSLGTRGPEFAVVKPSNTIRVLSLGDSKTFGWGLTEAESYSGLLERLLQERVGAKRKIEVINAGVNAYSYAQMFAYFRDRGLKYSPDFVIVADANLWTQFSEKNSPAFVKSFMNRVRLKNFLRRFATYHYIVEVKLKEVYERQRTKFIPVDPKQDELFKEQQAKDPNEFFRTYIEQLCSLALSNRVQPVLLYIPRLYELEAAEPSNVLQTKAQVGRQFQVPLVDLTPDLKDKGRELFLDADPVHLNVPGNVIIARRLLTTINGLISLP
jgi:lysophospholipase L1-like esterase